MLQIEPANTSVQLWRRSAPIVHGPANGHIDPLPNPRARADLQQDRAWPEPGRGAAPPHSGELDAGYSRAAVAGDAARIGADAFHHRTEAVRTLRGKMFAQTHASRKAASASVARMSLCGLPEKMANRIAIRPRTICASLSPANVSTGPSAPSGRTLVSSQTWLAQPCTLLASLCARLGKRWQFPSEFDQVAIAIVPIVKDREIVDDFFDIRHAPRVPQ